MEQVYHYFPNLNPAQKEQFEALPGLYQEWNARINLISRQDMENLVERHILHSLAIAKVMPFLPGGRLLDLGTGGGFPGVPLPILFPEVEFLLIDGTGKKIVAVQGILESIGATNAAAQHVRAEELKLAGRFDFVVTRAVAPLDKLLLWSQRLISRRHRHAYPNGILALKGGNLDEEIKALPGKGKDYSEVFPVSAYFQEPYFEEKSVVYVQS